MAQFVKLVPENLKALREVNPRLMSYNVEFAEVTGGTFWKAYTPEQVAGTEEFHVAPSAEGNCLGISLTGVPAAYSATA